MALATFTIVWFFLSATPFCSRLYRVAHSLLMPPLAQKSMKFLSTYFPPFSKHKNFIFFPDDSLLGFQKINPSFPGVVIDESDEAFGTTKSFSGDRFVDILVYQP